MPGMRGRWGLLIAVVVGGVGFVLFLLGFDGHTTEALPFGVAGLIAGAVIGFPAFSALRAATRPQGAWQPAPGQSTDSPPSSITCSQCGSAAPIDLQHTTHARCAHCQHQNPLPAELAARLTTAAAAVKSQAHSERQIAEVIASLPAREGMLKQRLLRLTGGLVAGALLGGLYGFAVRSSNSAWQGFVAFALLAGPITLAVGGWAFRTVPRITLGIVSRWAALQLPGVKGLACRVCGAPLPEKVAPVLRCEYCSADSLAGPEVLARVQQQSQHARASVLSVTHQSRDADERAAFSLVALPALVLVVWFAIGAWAGGVGLRWMHQHF